VAQATGTLRKCDAPRQGRWNALHSIAPAGAISGVPCFPVVRTTG